MEALARFAAPGLVIEGPASRAALALAAGLAAATAFAAPVFAAPASAAPSAAAHAAKVAKADYADAVRTVQAGLDAWLGKGRAVVVDRAAPQDAEARRVSGLLNAEGRKELADPALRSVVLGSGGTMKYGKVCLVVGGDPARSASDILSVEGVAKADPGDVGYRDAQVYDLWRQAALCGFETVKEAAAMAVLASARESSSRDLPALAAASAGLEDWAQVPAGNAGVAGDAALWAAAGAVRLRAEDKLIKAPYRALAAMAVQAGARQPSGYDLAPDVRRLHAARDLKAWYVPVREGAVSVDWRTWLRKSGIPEARHYGALLDQVEGVNRSATPIKPLGALRGTGPHGSVDFAAADARLGDTGALAFADLGEAARIEEALPEKRVESRGLRSWDEVDGQRIPFDRRTETLVAGGEGETFEIRDAATGHEIAVGTSRHGLDQEFRP